MIKEPLNLEQIHQVLTPESLMKLTQIDIFESIDSTNTYLLSQAKQNAPGGLVCLAEEQTAGRGRLERPWYSPRGKNIYCSLLWRFKKPEPDISGLSIAIGVMIVNALSQYGIQSGIHLKWPNDVLSAGRKLSGILLERNSPDSVVIGIGLNLDVQEAQEKSWIDVMEITGRSPRRNFLTGLLLNEMLTQLPRFEQQGLSLFLPEWQKHDALRDKNIVITTPQKKIHGVMRGINEAGELLLENESGVLERFRYGEVSVRLDK
jgi:BirA family biotin operon repressor/biotin-[acetyl-CoA-carboxylase] ligase